MMVWISWPGVRIRSARTRHFGSPTSESWEMNDTHTQGGENKKKRTVFVRFNYEFSPEIECGILVWNYKINFECFSLVFRVRQNERSEITFTLFRCLPLRLGLPQISLPNRVFKFGKSMPKWTPTIRTYFIFFYNFFPLCCKQLKNLRV